MNAHRKPLTLAEAHVLAEVARLVEWTRIRRRQGYHEGAQATINEVALEAIEKLLAGKS